MIERNERQPYHAQGRDKQPWIPRLRKNSRHIQSAQGHGQEQYSPQRISAECYQIHKERYTAESNEYRRQQLDTSTKRQLSPVALSLWRRDEHIIGQQMFEENPTQESQIHNELSQSDSGKVSRHRLKSTSGRNHAGQGRTIASQLKRISHRKRIRTTWYGNGVFIGFSLCHRTVGFVAA